LADHKWTAIYLVGGLIIAENFLSLFWTDPEIFVIPSTIPSLHHVPKAFGAGKIEVSTSGEI